MNPFCHYSLKILFPSNIIASELHLTATLTGLVGLIIMVFAKLFKIHLGTIFDCINTIRIIIRTPDMYTIKLYDSKYKAIVIESNVVLFNLFLLQICHQYLYHLKLPKTTMIAEWKLRCVRVKCVETGSRDGIVVMM